MKNRRISTSPDAPSIQGRQDLNYAGRVPMNGARTGRTWAGPFTWDRYFRWLRSRAVRGITGWAILLLIPGIQVAGQESSTAAEETKIAEVRQSSNPAQNTGRGSTESTPVWSTRAVPEQPPPVGLGTRQLRGTIEFGPRWTGVAGNQNMYRSHVNLGDGVKLYHSDLEITSPENAGILFDRFRMTMDSWGGDPYNTASVRFQKFRIYDFQYRYQKVDYFNFVPEFANPLFAAGVLEGRHTFDITRRMSNARIDFFPDSKRFKFHLSYGRNRSFGPSLITFNAGGDEFVIPRYVRNNYDDYGVGIDFAVWKFKFSVEQGYRRFRDDTELNQRGGFNIGNDRNRIFEGNPLPAQLFLSSFARTYHARGTFPTTRFGVTVQPHRRVSFSGRFYYGDADLRYNLSQAFGGLVFNKNLFSYQTNGFTENLSVPSRPQTVADWSFGVAITNRLTLAHTFRFDHFDVSSSTLVNDALFLAGGPFGEADPERFDFQTISDRRVVQDSYYNHVEARYELVRGLLLRAGFRHTHRNVDILKHANDLFFGEDATVDQSRLDTRTGLAGFSYRLRNRLRLSLDYENGSYDNVFTRVGAIEHQRGRFRAQIRPSEKWFFTVTGLLTDMRRTNRPVIRPFIISPERSSYLTNQNRYRDAGFSIAYLPTPRLAFDVDYTYGHAGASINLLAPIPGAGPLKYREESHVGHASVDLDVYKSVRISLGYSLVNNSGSYPINYHRPYGRLSIPLHRRVRFNFNYQYYGYNEVRRSVQDYHANLLTTSLRFNF